LADYAADRALASSVGPHGPTPGRKGAFRRGKPPRPCASAQGLSRLAASSRPPGLGLDWPEHGGMLHRSGPQRPPPQSDPLRRVPSTIPTAPPASKFHRRPHKQQRRGASETARKMITKFNPIVLDENHAGGNNCPKQYAVRLPISRNDEGGNQYGEQKKRTYHPIDAL